MTNDIKVRTSFSQNSTYVRCGQHWKLRYIDKLSSEVEGASTYFGSAMDAAVTARLLNQPNWVDIFLDKWYVTEKDSKPFQIFDNDNIVFGNNDFDADVLQLGVDEPQLLKWASELGLSGSSGVSLYKDIAKDKKNPYKGINAAKLKYFNRASWLSLKRKGEVLLKAFDEQFMPKVIKVHDTQKFARLEDNGDVINGVIDMVLEIEGYNKPIIFDLKTASRPYEQQQIELTEQLTLYAAMKGAEYNTDLVGYVVLSKQIPKEVVSTCNSCGNVKSGRHMSCNSVKVTGTRCSGTWTEVKVLKPEVQVLVESKTPEQINSLMIDYANIIEAMRQRIVFKNTSNCSNWFGSKCIFYDKCHSNSDKGLTKKG